MYFSLFFLFFYSFYFTFRWIILWTVHLIFTSSISDVFFNAFYTVQGHNHCIYTSHIGAVFFTFLQIQIKIITTILVTFYYLILFPLSCILDSFYSIFSSFFIFSWCFLSFYIVFCLFFIVYITLFFVNHFDVVSLKNKLCITYYGFWNFPKI